MIDFTRPQRQSPIGVIVMFLDTAKDIIKNLWAFILIVFLRYNQGNYKIYIVGGLVSLLVLLIVGAYLRYRNFTFFIDDENEEFVINHGTLSKTKTAIRLEKIQQVNISQSLVQRLIGVFSLEIDTAGSNDKEGVIRAISHPLALALKSRLLEESKNISAGEAIDQTVAEVGKSFITISTWSLIKTGLTSNYLRTVALIFAFFFTIYENVQGFINEEEEQNIGNYVNVGSTLQTLAVVVILGFIIVMVVNLARTILQYYNFSISRQQRSLLLKFGLFTTKSTIVRPSRVQILTVVQNFLQRKTDLTRIRISQAGAEHDVHKQLLEIPGCSKAEKDALLNLLYDSLPEAEMEIRPNYRKLIQSTVLFLIVPLSIIIGLVNWISLPYLEYVPWIYTALVAPMLLFSYRNSRLFLSDRFVMVRSGAWDVSLEIVETSRIQAVEVSQLLWHRAADVGSLTLYTAGGAITFWLGNFSAMRHYVDRWLYKIESSNANWM